MKSWLKIIFKIAGGGFGAVFLLLYWNTLKDILFYITRGTSCEYLIAVPVHLFVGLFFVSAWDDWAFLFFAFGSLFVLIIQLRPLLNVYVQKQAKQLFLILLLALFVLTGFGINFEVKDELAIKRTYSEFCQAAKDGNYKLAYSYFSPEYRSKTGVNRFAKEIMDSFSYTGGCGGEFSGTIHHRLNGSFLYPFRWTNSACYLFLGGPELVLVKVDGKWYFTGEHNWYMD